MTNFLDGWILAIDFGTSNTAAAVRSNGANEVLELSRGSRTMPSGVILDARNGSRVGEMAERLRALHPDAYEENPKNLVGMPPQIYEGRLAHAEEFVAEIFREVRRIALDRKAGVEPAQVVLTHPSAWGGVKTQQLLRAAERAGFDRRAIVLLEEPIAAAHHFRHEAATGESIPLGGLVLVFDFGGGTLDLALVERTEDDEFEVKDIEAMDNLGGNNLDDALWNWTLSQIATRNPDAITYLKSPSGRREEATLRELVRRAKEDLSFRSATEVPVIIGSYDETFRPTIEEYEELIRPHVDRAVALTRTLLDRNDRTKVVRFYLTGGSSLTPLVARSLAQATGITPTRLGDPKTVVVDGALSAVATSHVASRKAEQPQASPVEASPGIVENQSNGAAERLSTQEPPKPFVPSTPVNSQPPTSETVPTPGPTVADGSPGNRKAGIMSHTAPVGSALVGGILLVMSGLVLLIALQQTSGGTGRDIAIIAALLMQAAAMAALAVHHWMRPLKEGRVEAALYAGLMILGFVMASTTYNDAYPFFHFLFGILLTAVGLRLFISTRQGTGLFLRSRRTPAHWLIGCGAAAIVGLATSIASSSGSFVFRWLWPLSIIGVAVGYIFSANLLKREVTGSTETAAPGADNRIDNPQS